MPRSREHVDSLAKSQFIDTLADTQMEPANLAVNAGVADLRVLYHNGKVALPVSVTIQTSTNLHRGVHMSRLVQAASRRESRSIEKWLKGICASVNDTQPGAFVTCRFEMPYSDRFIPVAIRTTRSGAITYQLVAKGMTACPCSKKMIGVGHMQRAEIVMTLKSRKELDMVETIRMMDECFSAVPKEKMKRVDEAKKILEAQDNPRFAEDLVRECVKRFPNSLHVQARCFESIHDHDALATWSRNNGWLPAL
jgi:GTP cyclohydrolase FolE2